ncbi:hypothetical protein ONZ45_g17629 [Pleurotus djamor]|nr:hypothetical protein ONZ45_g17629 [Pleurotus djamor]
MPKDETGKRGKGKGKSPQPEHVPRPPNAWILYRADKLMQLKQSANYGDALQQSHASKIIGQMWKQEPQDVRDYYDRLARQKKEEHKVMHPGYKYQPKSKLKGPQAAAQEVAQEVVEVAENEAGPSSRPYNQPSPPAPVVPALPVLPSWHPTSLNALLGSPTSFTPPLSAAPTDADSDSQPDTPNNTSPVASSSMVKDTTDPPFIHNPRPISAADQEDLLRTAESLAALPAFQSLWGMPGADPIPSTSSQWPLETPTHQDPIDPLLFNIPEPDTTAWDPLAASLIPTDSTDVFHLVGYPPNLGVGDLELMPDMALSLWTNDGYGSEQQFDYSFPTTLENGFPAPFRSLGDEAPSPPETVPTISAASSIANLDFSSG